MTIQDIASTAAAYVQRGWAVIQLHDVSAGACSCQEGQYCDSAGKHPIARAWQLDYLSTTPEVYAAWAARPRAGIGIITGPPSGIWVLDVDPGHGGAQSLANLEAEHGPLPKTYTVRTGSGGAHLYFALSNVDFDLTNSTGGRGRFPGGLDVRGRGGFVVAPPSVSGRGGYVALADPDLPHLVSPVAEAPIWAIERQRPKPYIRPEIKPGEELRDGHAYALAAVRGELEEMAAADIGTRNDTAFKTGCRIYELAIAPWARLDFQQIEQGFFESCAIANVDGRFPYGEAWSVWLRVQRRVTEPAVLPPATHMGTVVGWVDAAGSVTPTTDFDYAEQGSAVLSQIIADQYESEVIKKLRDLRVYEDAKGRLDASKFLKGWREPTTFGHLGDELALPVEELVWRVAGLLPASGNAVVVAPRKAGKTTLIGSLIRSLVDGIMFLGRYPVEPVGSVALFNYENTARQQRQWLRELEIANPDRVHILHLRGTALSLAVPQVRRYVTRWLLEREVQVWIPDPYARAGQGVILNENDNGQANQFTGLLDEIKAESSVAEIVMPAHSSNKGDVESGSETTRGAGRLEDWADAIWYLTSVEDQRFLRATGRDVELNETQIHFDIASRGLTIGAAGRGRREVAIDRDAARISEVLRNWTGDAPATQRQLEEACDFANRRVAAAVRRLCEQSLAWTEEGPNRAKYHHHGPKPNEQK